MENKGHAHRNPFLFVRPEHLPVGSSDKPSTTSLSKKIDGKEGFEPALVSITPEKKPQPPVRKRISTDTTVLVHNKVVEVPKKYENIVELFDQMICSIRLLNLRKKPTTFRNISYQLEVLTRSIFQYNHLAQMKYLFPEAIEIEKILIHDKTSLCMVPELKISLSITSVEDLCIHGKSPPLVLCQVFRSRLLNFISNHPEHIDIPEAVLPDHFNNSKQSRFEAKFEETSEELHSTSIGSDIKPSTSLLLPSLSKQCPEHIMIMETKSKSLHHLSPASELISIDADKFEENCSQSSDGLFQTGKSTVKLPPSPIEGETHCFYETTPLKHVRSCSNREVLTLAPLTPKIPNSNGTDEKQETEIKLSVQSARRSLLYSPSKTGSARDLNFCVLECSSSSLFSSHNLTAVEGTLSQGEPVGKKYSNFEMRKDASGVASSGASDHQKMLAGLPDLFDTIRIIFQSISSHTITKQELLHKILLHNFDIEELDQAEELLHLMEKMIPDWISAKTASSEDLLYSIQKMSDIESIRAKLVNAL